MQGYRRQVESQECKVLGYEGIDTCIVKLVNKTFNSRNFSVLQDSIERHVDPGTIKVGKTA